MPAHPQNPASGHLQLRRAMTTYESPSSHDAPPEGGLPDSYTDSLVDKVVERIERRVIEELERRGLRQGRGMY